MRSVVYIFYVVIFISVFHSAQHVADAFSAGVPPLKSVCSDMLPHHHSYKPQSTPAPYEITTSSNTVAAGSDIIVTLKSTEPGTLFRGFYMQARDDDYNAIGSFTPNNDAKAHSCKGIRYNAAHHANGKIEKPSASVVWTAPKDYTGEVVFLSTIVKNFVTIWAGVYSEPVMVTPFEERSSGLFGSSDGSSDGGIGGLLAAFGINIPGITPQRNNRNGR